MLIFENDGEIDPRLITTLGVNIKLNESPIGFFGTGLKYAIAITLRLGGQVQISSGDKIYSFATKRDTIRGKSFDFIVMGTSRRWQSQELASTGYKENSQILGFTTDLGKNWEPWMAYREFRSNTLDEGGEIYTSLELVSKLGKTCISVYCPEIEAAYANEGKYFLTGSPLWSGHGVAVYPGPAQTIFYHGIRALPVLSEMADRTPYHFSYSLLGNAIITEDRSFASIWEVQRQICGALIQCDNPDIINSALNSSSEFSWDWNQFIEPSPEFIRVCIGRISSKQTLPSSARDLIKRYAADQLTRAEICIPESWAEMCELAPTAKEMSSVSIYDYVSVVERRIEELEAELAWWKACAEKLAHNLPGRVDG